MGVLAGLETGDSQRFLKIKFIIIYSWLERVYKLFYMPGKPCLNKLATQGISPHAGNADICKGASNSKIVRAEINNTVVLGATL